MLLNAKWLTYCTGEYKGIDDKYGNPSPYFPEYPAGQIKPADLGEKGPRFPARRPYRQ